MNKLIIIAETNFIHKQLYDMFFRGTIGELDYKKLELRLKAIRDATRETRNKNYNEKVRLE